MSQRPKISLCVIVKDQEVLLRRLLDHHRDIYDEAIVVDTGSADGSPETATEMGAVVGHFPWIDDFGAARNHGLDMATGDWILVLDCDEIIGSEGFTPLRQLVRDSAGVCFSFPQLNYYRTSRGKSWEPSGNENPAYTLGAPGFLTAWTIRLFPNRPSIRYRGVVHETLEASAVAEGFSVQRWDLPIHHHGHLLKSCHSRTATYGHLLNQKLKNQPQDPQARYEMAAHLAAVGQLDLAARLLESILQKFPHWNDRHRAELLLGDIRQKAGWTHLAKDHFLAALMCRPDWPTCWEAVIASHLFLHETETASKYLTQARRLFPLRSSWDGLEAQVSGKSGR